MKKFFLKLLIFWLYSAAPTTEETLKIHVDFFCSTMDFAFQNKTDTLCSEADAIALQDFLLKRSRRDLQFSRFIEIISLEEIKVVANFLFKISPTASFDARIQNRICLMPEEFDNFCFIMRNVIVMFDLQTPTINILIFKLAFCWLKFLPNINQVLVSNPLFGSESSLQTDVIEALCVNPEPTATDPFATFIGGEVTKSYPILPST